MTTVFIMSESVELSGVGLLGVRLMMSLGSLNGILLHSGLSLQILSFKTFSTYLPLVDY